MYLFSYKKNIDVKNDKKTSTNETSTNETNKESPKTKEILKDLNLSGLC